MGTRVQASGSTDRETGAAMSWTYWILSFGSPAPVYIFSNVVVKLETENLTGQFSSSLGKLKSGEQEVSIAGLNPNLAAVTEP